MPSIIQAGNAASTGLVTTGATDGILELRSGTAAGGTVAMTVDAAQNITFTEQPIVPVQSMVRLHTANGYGSTNTVIRRFTTVVTNQGSDITYADSAALGATFTINANGVYAISYSGHFNVANGLGISLNSTQLTTDIQSINAADRLTYADTGGVDFTGAVSSVLYLTAGAVIRAHTNGTASGVAPERAQFTITRVA